MALLLVSRRQNNFANRFLAIVMVAFAVDLLSVVYFTKGYVATYPHFMGVDYLLPFLYGPMLYLYAKTLIEGSRRLNAKLLLHFLPLVLAFLFLIPFYLQSGPEKLALHMHPESHIWTARLNILNDFKLYYTLVYMAMIFYLLYQHQKRVKNNFSSLDKITLSWLRHILLFGIAGWGISFAFQILWPADASVNPLLGNAGYVSVALACFVYTMGYLGLRQPEIFSQPVSGPIFEPEKEVELLPEEGGDKERDAAEKYARSGMDKEMADALQHQLLQAMDKKQLFKQSGLTLSDLAKQLNTSPHYISEVLNLYVQKTFYDFVNGYRIEEVKKQLVNPDNNHLTVLAIGLDAGFNSKSSFNSVFKKYTSMTPSEYRKSLKS